jgi:hypothetical protein
MPDNRICSRRECKHAKAEHASYGCHGADDVGGSCQCPSFKEEPRLTVPVMALSFDVEEQSHQCRFVSNTESSRDSYICCTKREGHEGQHEPHWAVAQMSEGMKTVVRNMTWRPRRRTEEERLHAKNEMLKLVIHAREREMSARERAQ